MSQASIILSHHSGILRGTVQLPASKSESNRALLVQALCPESVTLHNLSDANDTVLLERLLNSTEKEVNAEDAGTVMRFLTAYFSLTNQKRILTGTERMCQRPIGILVNALRELGAEINYLGEEGFPPLEVLGFEPKHKSMAQLKLRGDVSSQYISALLLCAPVLPFGLELQLEGKVASRPYIEMTLSLMKHFCIGSSFTGNHIEIQPQQYKGGDFSVEADWSAASYWYSMVALAEDADIFLPGLKENSLQGDSKVAELMKMFGVKTVFSAEGISLSKTQSTVQKVKIDFSDIPDLAQTFAVIAAAKNVELEMTRLESLRIKETDRVKALQTELAKFGVSLKETNPGTFNLSKAIDFDKKVEIDTYDDHRMAMAFAPLALLGKIEIENPAVVRKSYPKFWEELTKVGFEIAKV